MEEPQTLSYTWASAGETTTVTWTVTEGSDGTTHFDQSRFSEATKARQGAIEGAKYAWINNGNQPEKVLAEL